MPLQNEPINRVRCTTCGTYRDRDNPAWRPAYGFNLGLYEGWDACGREDALVRGRRVWFACRQCGMDAGGHWIERTAYSVGRRFSDPVMSERDHRMVRLGRSPAPAVD